MAIALGWTNWRLFFQPVNVEDEIIDIASVTGRSTEEMWEWTTNFRRRFVERYNQHKKHEAETIKKGYR